jgi:hypothetical protein
MSIKEFLKKIFYSEKETEKQETRIDFTELEDFLNEKLEKLKDEKQEIKDYLIEKTKIFTQNLEQQIEILEKTSIDKRKEQEKIKLVVNQNKEIFIDYTKKFISELNSLQNLETNEYIEKKRKTFENFNKISKNSFEKATILIGEELGKTREIIVAFFNEFNKTVNEKTPVLKEINQINHIKELFNELGSLKESENQQKQIISDLNKKIEKNENQKSAILNQISDLRKSQEYKESEKQKHEKKENLK